jgi:hypothetical protein
MPAILLLVAFICFGCASPGPPRPPSLRLPQLVNDLSAERLGGRVVLRWTTPSRTTDDLDIKGPMTAELCRQADTRSSPAAARPTACAPVLRLPVLPGPSEATDILPPAFQADPVKLLAYHVQLFNSAGHSAGNSTMAFTPAGAAPQPVALLRAAASEQGAVLEWSSPEPGAAQPNSAAAGTSPGDLIDLKRIDLSAPPPPGREPKPAAVQPHGKSAARSKSPQSKKPADEAPNEAHLRAPDSPSGARPGTAGTVDTTAAMGSTYTYVAQRVRVVTIEGRKLEIASEPSAPVTLAMRDTFPPKPPSGLATISGTAAPDPALAAASPQPYIDLSWEPNTEPDLAGYRVYRQLARPDGSPQGPLARLTPLPIAVPAYRDVAVRPGQGYIYSVTAVDAAGNESAPSAKALESLSDVVSH